MVASNTRVVLDDTRQKLLDAALRQFAERGFYGASIAQIAGEVGLTKQALLYHFRRKEDLYSEVLKDISQRLQSAMETHVDPDKPPIEQFEDMMIGFYEVAQANPLDTRVLMRELLDDQRREAPSEEWHLKHTLDRIVATLNRIEGVAELPFAQKFARIYTAVSAIEFFIGSNLVLKRFYGEEEFAQIREAYPHELRVMVRQIIEGGTSLV